MEPAKKTPPVETPIKYDDVTMPKTSSETLDQDWSDFFAKNRPYPLRVRQWVMKLHRGNKHKEIISCLSAALNHSQAQPWMYEVLALSMQKEGYPKEDIERVVLSLSDFGAVTYDNLVYSAAYLTRFDRREAALKLYREASRIAPERHEPYVLGLKLAKFEKNTNDIQWATVGILQNYWGKDYKQYHLSAQDVVFDHLRDLKREGKSEEMQQLARAIERARVRDVSVKVEWSGDADLDLQVEEPPGSVCSYEIPLTYAGGIFLHDGAGPEQSLCYESYVCPQGVTGTYRVRVKKAYGNIVGNRAVVTVTLNESSKDEAEIVRTVVLDEDEASFTFDLKQGRRTKPRELTLLRVNRPKPNSHRRVVRLRDLEIKNVQQAEAKQEFLQERRANSHRPGAVGFSPVVQTIPEGSTLSAQAVVSADRRYVRLSLQPTFTNITDVFTFSILNGGGGNSSNQLGGN